MDDLPELPFEQVLSYLSLEDLLKSRTVSRAWKMKTDNFRVKSLCYSSRPSGFIEGKAQWVSGVFAQNFISSSQFECFFATFGQSILSNLKHLRLCDLRLNKKNTEILRSFGQLEELDLIRFSFPFYPSLEFELHLPMLRSIQLKEVSGIQQLTLDTPRLLKVKLLQCFFSFVSSPLSSMRLDLVHSESVERLITDVFRNCFKMKQFKNLKYFYYTKCDLGFVSTLLIDLEQLEQLREIHLNDRDDVTEIFKQKQRYGRADLKIFLFGLLLNGSNDQISSFKNFNDEFVHLAENPSRLADEIPFSRVLNYAAIERVAPGSEIAVVKRLTELNKILVDEPVQDVERFLDFLKKFDHIVELWFNGDQPQDLFDRLSEHCVVQKLLIRCAVSDLRFLLKLKHLKHLTLLQMDCQFDAEFIRKVFEELPFLTSFSFQNTEKRVRIVINQTKQFEVVFNEEQRTVADLNAAIQFFTIEDEEGKEDVE